MIINQIELLGFFSSLGKFSGEFALAGVILYMLYTFVKKLLNAYIDGNKSLAESHKDIISGKQSLVESVSLLNNGINTGFNAVSENLIKMASINNLIYTKVEDMQRDVKSIIEHNKISRNESKETKDELFDFLSKIDEKLDDIMELKKQLEKGK